MTQLDDDQKAFLVKQVEFYFSDSNLPRDKFMSEKVAENAEGYVDLAIICAFNRMKTTLKLPAEATPATVPAALVTAAAEALRASQAVEINAEGTRVKRKAPLRDADEVRKENDARSVYVRPLPMDASIDELTKFFSAHGTVNCVTMRRHMKSKGFKGSVFIEFGDDAAAEAVLAASLTYEGAPLVTEKKVVYMERKKAERKEKDKVKDGERDDNADDSNDEMADGMGEKVGPKRARTTPSVEAPAAASGAGANKRTRDGDKPAGGKKGAPAAAAAAAGAKKGDAADADAAAADAGDAEDKPPAEKKAKVEKPVPEKKKDVEHANGCLVAFTMDDELPDSITARTMVDLLGGRDKIKFLELNNDKKSGTIRFHTPEGATAAIDEFAAKDESERVMAGTKAQWSKLEGELEAEFYKRAQAAYDKKEENSRGGGRDGGRGRGRGGGRQGRRPGRQGGQGGPGRPRPRQGWPVTCPTVLLPRTLGPEKFVFSTCCVEHPTALPASPEAAGGQNTFFLENRG
ncbi:hypothetical protein FOA52_004736 [Chlamydomonas sp. UWO 241]|nr:hypothetical protein FOA52_004736 [Chlamydomonas sp. UWO 241]